MGKIVVMDSEYCSMGRWISIIVGTQTGLKLYEGRELCQLAGESWLTIDYLNDFDERIAERDPAELASDPEFIRVHTALSRAIRMAADQGPCFIHERAASAVLANRDDLLRVMLYCTCLEDKFPRAEFDPHFPELVGATSEQLTAHIERQDRIRAVYHDAALGGGADTVTWGAKEGYDLCLNSATISREKCAEVIIEAVSDLRLDPAECKHAVDEFTRTWAQ